MGRIRTIKPEFPKDELLGSLPRDVRLLYVLLWTLVDDEGRFRASPALLRAELFPYDDLAAPQVAEWLYALEDAGRVRLYSADGQQYGHVVRFREHQRIEKPSESKLPPPPAEDSPTVPRILPEPSPTVPGGIGREGKGREREKKPPAQPPAADPLFEEFWSAYPKRDGKKAAQRRFDKLAAADREPAIAAAKHYATACRAECREARFILHGSTFLGPDERWRDFAQGPPKSANPNPQPSGALPRWNP